MKHIKHHLKKHVSNSKSYLIIGALLGIIALAGLMSGGIWPQNGLIGKFSTRVKGLPEATQNKVVELKDGDTYNLTASIVQKTIKGEKVKMLAYNGSIPGPLIKVPQGANITIHFTNNTDVDSTIHAHGIRGENKFDGVANLTQEAVKPGGQFTYKLRFPDAGIFWYHPHVREDYAQDLGLYGNFLVTPAQKDYWGEVDREQTLFLDDVLVENGKIADYSSSKVDHTLMGRFGNVMLVNGDDNYRMAVKQGERVRFYVTNVASSRVFNFAVPNTRMKLVGADNGKYEREEWKDTVTIGPSERAIVEIWFDKDGEYNIVNKTPDKTYSLGTIAVKQNPVTTSYFLVPRVNQDYIDSLEPLRQFFTKAPDKKLDLTLAMASTNNGMQHMMGNGQMMGNNNQGMRMGDIKKIEWEDDMGMMNSQSTTDTLKWELVDEVTKKSNMDINWQFKKGEIVKIEIFNDDKSMHPMQHPIHIHGQRFLVLSTNGQPNQNLVWKDTALIQTGDRVQLLVQMDNPGEWMIHCHIPEHMESGMMSKFEVL